MQLSLNKYKQLIYFNNQRFGAFVDLAESSPLSLPPSPTLPFHNHDTESCVVLAKSRSPFNNPSGRDRGGKIWSQLNIRQN